MMIISFVLFGGLSGAGQLPPLENAIPARIAGPWEVEVGPGTVTVEGRTVTLPAAVRLTVRAPEAIRVRDECHPSLPVFDKDTGGWRKGAQLTKLIAEECTATGLFYPESVRVKPASGEATPFKLGVDYSLDSFWGTLGRLDGGAIAPDQPVFVDYEYSPSRLDSIVADTAGHVRLVAGAPHVALAKPPDLAPGETAIANVWAPGRTEKLSEENLYPIEFRDFALPKDIEKTAERCLPKTLAKLKAGDTVTIVAFGDSVTHGGGVDGHEELWYQNQFASLLRKRFPKATIRMLTAAWPGGNSKGYMEAPKGGTYDFVRDVLDPKPDLVTIEFVNDAYLDDTGTQAHYATILKHLHGVGAEVILITPHLVRPDWMSVGTLKFDDDPRPYVAGLRRFARENNVALADASQEWRRLWRKGIPYVTLLANAINHPDARGHEIFARKLIELFPAGNTQ